TDSTGYDLAELLKGMGEESMQSKSSRGTICKNCGFSQSDFKKTGRMGCSECYEVFADGLESLLNAMHKGTHHLGKIPPPHRLDAAQQGLSDEIESLQKKLMDSVEQEDYEEAARIRDELRKLEAEVLRSGN
ncbi:MAG: UvrB/UvrC motif-containing protein, partial [Verrucomicrobiota bacterium]